ncbi:MAG: fibronectin type III-like domain-contianing protein, partial [Flavobacteriales bacterium]|nr:fibronectin type III-like domain-contianing protein [Flavobacteriales bacterium]
TLQIRNLGTVAGAEVVQVYVSSPDDGAAKPVKLLRAFRKVPLQPGEAQEVTLTIPMRDLAHYDVKTGSWKVQGGSYRLLVGNSSRQSALQQIGFSVSD